MIDLEQIVEAAGVFGRYVHDAAILLALSIVAHGFLGLFRRN